VLEQAIDDGGHGIRAAPSNLAAGHVAKARADFERAPG